MILVITNAADAHADIITGMLKSRNISYYRLDTEKFLDSLDVSVSISNEGNDWRIIVDNEEVNLSTVKAAWFRRPMPGYVNPGINPRNRGYVQEELAAVLSGIWHTLPCIKWVNSPVAVLNASNKILQLNMAKKVGLQIPKTLITSNPNAARDFYTNCGQNIIVKVLTRGIIQDEKKLRVVFTNRIANDDYGRFDDVKYAPTQLQEYIDKAYELRITIVGNKIFTCEIHSQESPQTKTDWRRYADVPYKEGKLPQKISEALLLFMKSLNLRFGAIDMIYTPDGRYIFLEVNPSGQWFWVEEKIGLPICDALITELTSDQ